MFFKKEPGKVNVSATQIMTYIGVDTRIEGTVITKSSIRIDGTVVGGVCSDGTVILSKSGRIQGNVIAENIVIGGVVDGNMSIADKTNIEPLGEVYGDITTSSILVDETSVFQGKCNMNKDKAEEKKRRRLKVDEEDTVYEATSEADKKTSDEAKPAADAKTAQESKPVVETKPVQESKSVAETKPTQGSKQEAETKPAQEGKRVTEVKEAQVVKTAVADPMPIVEPKPAQPKPLA